MSVAVVGGAAIGVAGSMYGANKAAGAADAASQLQYESDMARLDWEKEQYAEWQDTYGGIEDNLSNYYETLSPTLRAVQGLEAFEKEKTRSMKTMRDSLSQRGIARSGLAASMEKDVAIESAEERARIRAAAPMDMAKEQLGFLQVGLRQDPTSGVSSAYSDQASNARSTADAAAQASGVATGALIEAGTNFASEALNKGIDYYNERKTAEPANSTGG